MARFWLVLKYVFATGLLLFAALMVLGWYIGHSRQEALANSPFIQQLDRAEREKGDVVKLLFDGMGKTDEKETELVIRWLKPREQRGDLPYLYVLGLYVTKQAGTQQKVEGIGYIAKAALVYRVDANKCGDATANQAVPIVESFLKVQLLRDSLKLEKNADLRKKTIASALAYEEKNKDRPLPGWICMHGLRSGSPPPGGAEWQQKRQAIRTSFEATF